MSDPAAQFARDAPGLRSAELLDTGTHLHVYAARLDDRSEPVRVLTPAPEHSTAVERAFERVAADWRDVGTHPNVVTVHSSGDTPRPWLALDAAGTPLPDLAPLAAEAGKQVVADAAEGLRAVTRADAGDAGLGPDAVRVDRSNGELTARIEFDVERVCRVATGERPVSPETPPEQLDAPQESDERSAVYRLGAVAFTVLTGEPLVLSAETTEAAIRAGALRPPAAVDPEIPRALGDVVWTALAFDPTDRYESPYEFKLALLFDASEPTSAAGHTQAAGPVEQQAPREDPGEAPGLSDEPPDATADGDDNSGNDAIADTGSFLSRRQALGALGLGVVGVVTGGAWLASAQLGSGGQSTDVPTYQYDAANTGYAPDLSGPTSGVTAEWTFGTEAPIISSPAVVDGTVYVGSEDNSLYALGADTGDQQWSVETDERVTSSPAVVDGTVYIRNWEGNTYALDAADGTRRWVTEGDGGRRGFLIPVVEDRTVYTLTPDGIAALDTADGSTLWTADVPPPQSLSLAFADGTLYYGTTDGLIALDGADGRELWHAQGYTTSFPSPTVVDGVVYSGDRETGLYALAADTGDEQWTFETDETVWSSPAVTDATVDSDGSSGRTVYGASGNTVYALDADGDEQWRRSRLAATVQASPVVVDETLYVGDTDGIVYALDATNGRERWRFETESDVLSSAAVVDGTVYVGSTDGTVYALTEP